VKQSTT